MTDIPTPTRSADLWDNSRLRARRRSELWLRGCGLAAIGIALLMLAIMLTTIPCPARISGAFRQTHVTNLGSPSRPIWSILPIRSPLTGGGTQMQDYIASVFPDAEPSELRQTGRDPVETAPSFRCVMRWSTTRP